MFLVSKPTGSRVLGWLELASVSSVALIVLGLLLILSEQLLLEPGFRLELEGLPGRLNLSRALAYGVWLLLLTVFLIWRLDRGRAKSGWLARLDLTRPGWPALGWGLIALLAAYGLSFSLILLLSQLELVNLDQRQAIGYSLSRDWSLVWAFLTLAVLVPIGEELLFRRWLWRRLVELGPSWLALPLASLAFGLVHLPPALAALDTLIFALAAILIYRRFGNLWPAIMMHAVKNAVAVSLLVAGAGQASMG